MWRKTDKAKLKTISLSLPLDLYEWVRQKENVSAYIRELIRRDMGGWSFVRREDIEEVIKQHCRRGGYEKHIKEGDVTSKRRETFIDQFL